ncbi:MAG: MiaB/RimO family radical SAM methylthiotransferase [Nitrospirae bacterium]|nr:MAG: MiaB/RimO family radical SAM methylthiotransferase [Nitrospirota bacterium]
MKISLCTLGCRVNQSESSVLEGSLKKHGATIVALTENPDVCIINTCTVTQKSDYTSRQLIRRATRTGARVIVTGCYSQLAREGVLSLSGEITVVDNKDKLDIVGMITDVSAPLTYHDHTQTRPYLKVQDGCNYRCTYCSVPLARGKSVSIPIDDLVERVMQISATKHEVVLTGIHLGTYGHDLPGGKRTINDLLRALLDRTDIHRIRLSSLEINEIDDETLRIMQDKRICRNLHIPLQSGSDKILKLMQRNYGSAAYKRRIMGVADRLGDIGLGTDIITGFPEEGIHEFQETLELVTEMPFTYLHVFPFSSRPGTAASSMKNRPSPAETKRRTDLLLDLGQTKKRHYMTGQIGVTQEIIVEGHTSAGSSVGTSSNYLKISVSASDLPRGTIADVRPFRLKKDSLEGVLIKSS